MCHSQVSFEPVTASHDDWRPRHQDRDSNVPRPVRVDVVWKSLTKISRDVVNERYQAVEVTPHIDEYVHVWVLVLQLSRRLYFWICGQQQVQQQLPILGAEY